MSKPQFFQDSANQPDGSSSVPATQPAAAEPQSAIQTGHSQNPADDALRVSIIILNFNGREHTRVCLQSLLDLDFPTHEFETIVVDNGSSDGSARIVRDEFPLVHLIENEKNLGFSRAANQAAAAARGKYLVFLNNDMRVEKDWLKTMLEVIRPDQGIVCAGSTILNWDATAIDFMGRPNDAFCLYYDRTELPPSPDTLPFPDKYALFVSFGAAVIVSEVFRELGGFDPDFFLYQEDVDLGWRLWLKGYKVVMTSRTVVYHRSGASSSKLPSTFVYEFNRKHALFSVFKNLEADNLRKLFPLLLYYALERSRFMQGGYDVMLSVIRGFESAINSLVSKRLKIQSERVVSDTEIFTTLGHPLNFLFRVQHYEEVSHRLAENDSLDFDASNPTSIREALSGWLHGAHLEYERFLLGELRIEEQERGSLVDQVAERQSAVESLTVQVTERHEKVLALTEQLAERERELILPVEQLNEKDNALTSLTAQVAEQQETIRTLYARLDEKERNQALSRSIKETVDAEIAHTSTRLAEAQQLAQKLESQLAKTEQDFAAQLNRQQQAIEVISAQLEMRTRELDKITSSAGWRLLSKYGQFKYRYLLPVYRVLHLAPAPVTPPVIKEVVMPEAPESVAGLSTEQPTAPPAPDPSPVEAQVTHESPSEVLTAPPTEQPAEVNDTAYREASDLEIEGVQLSREQILSRASEEWLPLKLRAAQELIRLLNIHPAVRGVVVFPQTIGWDINLFQRPQQLALALARQNYLVLYHNAEDLDGRAEFQRIAERLYLCYVPFEVFGFLERPIVFALHYNREHLRYFRNPRVVYEMIDELEVFHDKPERLQRNHLTLLKRATLVCVTADRLMDKVKPLRPDAVLVPNGVDYAHFEPARKRFSDEVPVPLRAIVEDGKPIIGYYGAHARWVDYELLRYAANARPDLNFLLIGPDHDDTLRASQITSLKNVRWLGPRPYLELPNYLRYFDVAIIPFVVDSITLSVSPLKLFEYLAGGKPVVTTDLPECRKYSQVLVARDGAEFVKLLDQALKLTDDMSYRISAMQTAQQNTWDERIRTIVQELEKVQANNDSDFDLSEAESDELISLLSEQVNEQKKTIASLVNQVAEKEENARTLVQAWAGIEQEKENANRERDDLVRQRDEVAGRLERITNSAGWRLLSSYGRIKYRYLLPVYRLFGQNPVLPAESQNGSDKQNMLQSVREKIQDTEPVENIAPPSAYDVVIFPIIDWQFRFQRPQQLATQFARDGHRVFYLRTTFHQGGTAAHAIGIAERVFEVQVPGPTHVNIYRDEINAQLLNDLINAMDLFRRRNMIEEAICVVQLPFWTPLALAAQQRWGWKVVYDCMDEHAGFSTNNATMLQHEETLVAQSDLVVASSRKLYDKLAPAAKRNLLLPNATDFEHFSEPGPLRPLAKLKGPIIGYYGAISNWFDVDMVQYAAQARPDWQFVLIGDTFGADVSMLKRLDNVHLLGEQPYVAIPSYLHDFDVAVIPFLLTPLTQSTNPVKFYEYLSAGKPVVSVELPELEPYRDFYYPVTSHHHFVVQIEKALRENSPEKIPARVELAKQNTWLDRYQTLSAMIPQLYGKAAVIIVSFKSREYLWLCLEHLWNKTLYPNYQVIVVDNGGQPDIVSYLQQSAAQHPQLKVILNDDNLGFARANNIGIEAAPDAEFYVLLNDDTIVTRHWLTRLLRHLRDKPVGLIGPVTNNAGNEGRIDVDYTIAEYKDVELMEEFAQARAREYASRSFDIPMLAMYCVAMRKSIIDEIGLLDEQFGVGMFEDDDFSLRVRQAGYRIVCAEDVFVHHWGKASFNQLETTAYYKLFDENRAKFEAKWGKKWDHHKPRRAVDRVARTTGPQLHAETVRFDWNEKGQLGLLLSGIQRFQKEYNRLANAPNPKRPYDFHLGNGAFDGTDAIVLYALIRHFRPNLIAVVDSGPALRLCVQAALLNGNTRVICIAPDTDEALPKNMPGLTGVLTQNPPEDILEVVDKLGSDDVLFFGSKFLEKIREDVNYPLLRVLPRLKPGVMTHFHGIFMPQEFPKEWMRDNPEYWGLQCALQIFLACSQDYEVLFGNSYMAAMHNREMKAAFPKSPWIGGGSFWVRRKLKH